MSTVVSPPLSSLIPPRFYSETPEYIRSTCHPYPKLHETARDHCCCTLIVRRLDDKQHNLQLQSTYVNVNLRYGGIGSTFDMMSRGADEGRFRV